MLRKRFKNPNIAIQKLQSFIKYLIFNQKNIEDTVTKGHRKGSLKLTLYSLYKNLLA